MFKDEPTTEDFEKLGNPDYDELQNMVKENVVNEDNNNITGDSINFNNIYFDKRTLTKEEVYVQIISWLGEIYTDEFDRNKQG